jgi:thiamine biosynthesis lipoprotein ApbE
MTTAEDLHTLVVGREAMACRFEVAFNAGELPEATALAVDALDLVEEIEARISVYRDTSEFARLNATAAAGWQPVSRDVAALLGRARELWAATGGAFDIAAGALVRTWGFLARQGRTPAPADLAAALARSGMRHVELDEPGLRVRFASPGVELNPGAIGKGWALDRALDRLSTAGVKNVLVHGGASSVRAAGVHGPAVAGRRGWRVGLVDPLRPGRRLATLTLVDRALGTSGSGTQFFLDRGRRIGHILDPRRRRRAGHGGLRAGPRGLGDDRAGGRPGGGGHGGAGRRGRCRAARGRQPGAGRPGGRGARRRRDRVARDRGGARLSRFFRDCGAPAARRPRGVDFGDRGTRPVPLRQPRHSPCLIGSSRVPTWASCCF